MEEEYSYRKFLPAVKELTLALRNEVVHKKREPSSPSGNAAVDRRGYFVFEENTVIDSKYVFKHVLGKGTYSVVGLFYDRESQSDVALKICRYHQSYHEACINEIEVLKMLRESKQSKRHPGHKIIMYHYGDFIYNDMFYCMVFKRMSCSLLDFFEINNECPFPISQIKYLFMQLIDGLDYIHMHEIIHTDIKLENILLVECITEKLSMSNYKKLFPESYHAYFDLCPNKDRHFHHLLSLNVKITDFGSARGFDEPVPENQLFCTRQYRPPEIILEIEFDKTLDIWSLAVVIHTLYTGYLIFPAANNLEQLLVFERVLGRIPVKQLEVSEEVLDLYFSFILLNGQKEYFVLKSSKEIDAASIVENCVMLRNIYTGRFRNNDICHLYNLITDMFHYDRKKRPDTGKIRTSYDFYTEGLRSIFRY